MICTHMNSFISQAVCLIFLHFKAFNMTVGVDLTKADVFSVGMVLYILAGQPDIWGPQEDGAWDPPQRHAYETSTLPMIPGIPQQAAEVLRRLLASDPVERLSAAAAYELLSPFVETQVLRL